jgi:hypothetical protein
MSSSVKSEGVWILPRDDESSCTFRGHDPSHGNVEAIEVASGGLAIGALLRTGRWFGALTSGSRTMWLATRFTVFTTRRLRRLSIHAREGGFPADLVCEVSSMIGQETGRQK